MKLIVAKLLTKLGAGLGGLGGWLVQLILPKLFEVAQKYILLYYKQMKLRQADEAALAEYKEALASGTLTRSERVQKLDSLLNRKPPQ